MRNLFSSKSVQSNWFLHRGRRLILFISDCLRILIHGDYFKFRSSGNECSMVYIRNALSVVKNWNFRIVITLRETHLFSWVSLGYNTNTVCLFWIINFLFFKKNMYEVIFILIPFLFLIPVMRETVKHCQRNYTTYWRR